jgi:hypothetical protein
MWVQQRRFTGRQFSWSLLAFCTGLLLLWAAGAYPLRAHQVLQVGNYLLDYSWRREPALAGEANSILIGVREIPASKGPLGVLTVITPLDDSTVTGDVLPVAVEIQRAAGDLTGLSWQITLDDQVMATPEASQPTVLLQGIAPGAHTLTLQLIDENEETEDNQPAVVQVTMQAATGEMVIPPPTNIQYSDVDISGLTFEVSIREQRQRLPIEALAPGQYQAPYTPTLAGVYLLHAQGVLDGEPVDAQLALDPVRSLSWTERLAHIWQTMLSRTGSVGGWGIGVLAAVALVIGWRLRRQKNGNRLRK